MNDNHRIPEQKYTSVKDYYPFYLTQHRNTTNRILHFIGTGLMGLCFITAMLFHLATFFFLMPVVGYIFPLAGHIFFEKNRPAPLKHSFFALISNFMLFGDLIMGRQSFRAKP